MSQCIAEGWIIIHKMMTVFMCVKSTVCNKCAECTVVMSENEIENESENIMTLMSKLSHSI